MADLETFDQCMVSVAGKIVANQTSVDVGTADTDEQIDLLTGGGEFNPTANSPGGRRLMIAWEMVIARKSGDDLKLWTYYKTGERVRIGVKFTGNGKTLTTDGVIQRPSIRSQVGATTTYSVGAMCDFQDWT